MLNSWRRWIDRANASSRTTWRPEPTRRSARKAFSTQEITPEKFAFPIQAINRSIQLTSQTVKIGEKYRIALRGLSSDDCNSTSATAEGTASTSTITLGELDWLTTEMACVQP